MTFLLGTAIQVTPALGTAVRETKSPQTTVATPPKFATTLGTLLGVVPDDLLVTIIARTCEYLLACKER